MASVKRRADGKWRARYRDEAGKEHARHFDRKVDGQRWLDEQTAAIVTGQFVDPKAGEITFRRFFADWAARQVWAPNSERAIRLAAGSVTFADVPMKLIRRSHVEQWVKAMQSKNRGAGKPPGLAPGTIKTRLQNVRAVLRAAVRDRIIVVDPSDGVKLPRQRRAAAAMVIPAPPQVRALLDNAAVPWMRTFMALAAFAGLRLGEAAGVQLADIDFLRRTLHVTRQVQRGPKGTVLISPPKAGSERPVFLADGLLRLLSLHVRDMPKTPEGWLFVGPDGDPPHQNSVGYWWRKTRRAVDLEEYDFHDLRHFYASGLIAKGCDVVTVQKALGHAKATTTLNIYAHLWPTAEDRMRTAADSLMDETFADPVRTEKPAQGA
ncbi:tyrosine-type recombinase/integrase [Actinoplanes sp. NPDC051411]|uniref:tyrosine-type recombinase/integrase n=1 Tax=Actinoplanes sp. NPDC051411 TaxID=3155522 RepID=UPI003424538D